MIIQLDENTPRFTRDQWIAPNATLAGNVILQADASIWFGSIIRAEVEPITVGPRSNVQDLCVLHTDPGYPLQIGADCTIGHKAMLHGCTIGDGSMIGINAVVLNGARIGKQCLIGAGALVPENVEIPDRSLVLGVPGRIKRELEDAELEKLRDIAAGYVERAQRYRSEAIVVDADSASQG
jgi:carbonic anhydrase/acetyltransferase-like protein (isoleucine patch superfamily)